jgi:glutamate dehydrogenase
MFRWLKQVGFAFAQGSVEDALAAHPEAARILLDLFAARFDPRAPRDAEREGEADAAGRHHAGGRGEPGRGPHPVAAAALLDATLRTNFYQLKDYLAFKVGKRAGRRHAAAPALARDLRPLAPAWRACISVPDRSRAAASAGPTVGRTSAPRSSG